MRSRDQILRTNRYEEAVLDRAEGCWMWDEDGHRYLDMEAGIWCCNLGHGNPAVSQAAKGQIDRIVHAGSRMLSVATLDAASALLDFVPGGYDKVTFLSSGTEAMELSIILAKLYTGKSGLLSFERSYLGAYGGSSSASGTASSAGCIKVPALAVANADCSSCPCATACANVVEAVRQAADDIACFAFEPVLGSGGLIKPCSALVRKLCGAVKDAGGLVVADEVTTGFGRTGKRFGFEHHGIRPDIVAMGKAIGNGFPVSAMVTTDAVEKACVDQGIYYAQSHQLDPFGCAIVKSVVETLRDSDLIERSVAKGERIRQCMEFHRKGFVKDVRGIGLMAGVEVCGYDGRAAGEYIDLISGKLLEKGVYIGLSKKYNMIRALPPLTISDDEITSFENAYVEVIGEI